MIMIMIYDDKMYIIQNDNDKTIKYNDLRNRIRFDSLKVCIRWDEDSSLWNPCMA